MGTSGGNLYGTGGCTTFKITVAETQSIDFRITKAKYGTLILPFKADVPDGMTAFTCNEIVGNVLTLEEADCIEANTPYIMYAENETEYTTFTGLGAAEKDSYKEGLLTGVFVEADFAATDEGNYNYILQKFTPKNG